MAQFKFDISSVQQQLIGEVGVKWHLSYDMDEAIANNALASCAGSFFGIGVCCVIVGMLDEGNQLFQKSREWFQFAIKTEERPIHYFKGATEAARHDLLAMCAWVLDSVHDHENLSNAINSEELWLEENRKDSGEVDLILPTYIDAEEYERSIVLYKSSRSHGLPIRIHQLKDEGTLAVLLAYQHLHSEYEETEFDLAVFKVLNRIVPELLGRGHYQRVAKWMKIIYWSEKKMTSPFDSLLKCYDHLPSCTPPSPTNQ